MHQGAGSLHSRWGLAHLEHFLPALPWSSAWQPSLQFCMVRSSADNGFSALGEQELQVLHLWEGLKRAA